MRSGICGVLQRAQRQSVMADNFFLFQDDRFQPEIGQALFLGFVGFLVAVGFIHRRFAIVGGLRRLIGAVERVIDQIIASPEAACGQGDSHDGKD